MMSADRCSDSKQPCSGDNVKWTRVFPGFTVSISEVILSAGELFWSKQRKETRNGVETRNEGVLSNVIIM